MQISHVLKQPPAALSMVSVVQLLFTVEGAVYLHSPHPNRAMPTALGRNVYQDSTTLRKNQRELCL
jgi:hypothetical protein